MLGQEGIDELDRMDSSKVSYRHCSLILHHGNKLWLGDYASAEDVEQLRAKHIRTGTCRLT